MTYSCETSGCDEEGICRCGKIVDEHVMSVDLSLVTDEIYDQLFPRENQSDKRENILSEIFYGGEKVDKYCIYRILAINESYYPENWRVNISGGYYGDEIDGITMDLEMYKKINEQCQKLKELTTLKDKINYVIFLEYGHLLEDLKNVDYELVAIYKNHIDFKKLNQNHIKNVKMKDLDHYSYTNYILPRGIVRGDTDNYKIVDGYHRIIAIDSKIPFLVFRVKK
jgi:hypothetical protein